MRDYKRLTKSSHSVRVNYTPERLTKLGEEASKPNSILSTEDRMGLVSDAMVLAKSGHSKTSSALSLISGLKSEPECETFANSFRSSDVKLTRTQ